jgi:hypothetical protein
MTPAGGNGSARQSQTSGRHNGRAWQLIGLAALIHVLRSRRLYENAAVSAIAVAALRKMAQESQAKSVARFSAWNKRQVERFEREVERQSKRVGGTSA